MIGTLALLCVLLPQKLLAQQAEDNAVEHLLQATDEPAIDIESIFDEAEAAASDVTFRSRTRYSVDPDARDESGAQNNQFLGSPAATLEKLQAGYGPIDGGFAGQKDAWESSYVDDWSGFLELHEPARFGNVQIQQAIVGSYALRFGSGLLFGSGSSSAYLRSSPARQMKAGSTLRHSLASRSHTSLFGAATDLDLGRFSFTPFYSARHLDARLDSLGVQTLYSYYHRTADEEANRNALIATVGGAHLGYIDSSLIFGATISHTVYDQALHTESSRIVSGRHLDHAGVDATIIVNGIELSLEAAAARADSTFGGAVQASITASPSRRLQLLAIYHRQDTNYFAPFAATSVSSEGDITNNEGYWLGFESLLSDDLRLSGALEMSDQLKSATSQLTDPHFDEFVDLRFKPSHSFSASLRYRSRYTSMIGNIVLDGRSTAITDNRSQSNLRLLASYWPASWLECFLRSEVTELSLSTRELRERGGFVQLNCRLTDGRNNAHFDIARFSTASYDSRLYSYAPEVSGMGSMLLLNGSGYFAAVGVRREIFPWLVLEAYGGGYFYDHSRGLGSGLTARSGARDLTGALQLTLTRRP